MKKPINDGKEIPKQSTHKINTIEGSYQSIKNKNKVKVLNRFEPKKLNRFKIEFKGEYKDIPPYVLKKTHRPKLINGEWGDLTIILFDPIAPSTSYALINAFRNEWQNNGVRVPKISYVLMMLDPTGAVIEEWHIKGTIELADFGDLDYANDKLTTIKLVIKPIEVILNY